MYNAGMEKPRKTPGPVDIADLRRRLGGDGGPISQAQLARDLETTQASISRMENDPSLQKGPIAVLLRKLDAETPEPGRMKVAS